MPKSKNEHKMAEKHNVRLSKALSWLLRHNIVQVNYICLYKCYLPLQFQSKVIIAHFPIITVTNIFPCCQEGLSATKEGFVDVEDVLAHPRFRGYLFKDVESVVRDNDKQRFALRKSLETGRWQIRANQGHTIKVIIMVI